MESISFSLDRESYLSRFVRMLTLRNLAEHTVKAYRAYLVPYLDYCEQIQILPESMSWVNIREFLSWVQESRKIEDRTMNCVIAQLRAFHLYVLRRPWDRYQIPYRKYLRYLPYVPSQEEMESFISSIRNSKFLAVCAVLYSSGIRAGELCHIRTEHIDRENLRLYIPPSKNRSDRYAILSKRSFEYLDSYWHSCAIKPQNGWLFAQDSDPSKPLYPGWINKRIRNQETVLGLPHRMTCHCFRHALGTHLYEIGTDLLDIKEILGHHSLSSTEIYIHTAHNRASRIQHPFDLRGELHG